MGVEGGCLRDLQAVHQSETGAVRKAEPLIRILAEQCPGRFLVLRRQTHKRAQAAAPQMLSVLYGHMVTEVVTKNGDQFVKDEVGGHQWGRGLAEKVNRLPVMNVTREGVRVKETGIHKYLTHRLYT
jgi:hypothetical protein